MLSDILSLFDDEVLGNVARQFIFLGLGEALLESVGALHDVLLVKAQVLVDEEYFRDGGSQAFEGGVEVFAPLGIFSRGDSLRPEHDLEVFLDVLVVGLERVVHVESLDPGSVDFDLVDITGLVVVAFVFVLVFLVFFFLVLLRLVVPGLACRACVVVIFFFVLRDTIIDLPNRSCSLDRISSHRSDQVVVKSPLQLLSEQVLLFCAHDAVFRKNRVSDFDQLIFDLHRALSENPIV